MIAAVKRGVKVRLIHDPQEYRNTLYWQDAYNVDLMYMNSVPIKHRAHRGLMHEAAVVMHGLGEVIFGSSNWSQGSANYQLEHNYFYNPSINKVVDSGDPLQPRKTFYEWFADQFNRKWSNTSAFVPFQPLPPDAPAYSAPVNGAAGVPVSATLRWQGGYWAHKYDIYFGTSPTPPRIAADCMTKETKEGGVAACAITGGVANNAIETYTRQESRPRHHVLLARRQ